DFHHKTALALLRHDDTIYLEDLQVRTMVRNPIWPRVSATPGGASSALSSRDKAVWVGKRVIAVPAQYTSQDCSGCGERVAEKSVGAHPSPSGLRPGAGPRRKRGTQHAVGRAGASASGGNGRRDELRSHGFSPGKHVTRAVLACTALHGTLTCRWS